MAATERRRRRVIEALLHHQATAPAAGMAVGECDVCDAFPPVRAPRCGKRRASCAALYVEIAHAERVRLDEVAARLDLLTHQRSEDVVGRDGVLDLDLEQPA